MQVDVGAVYSTPPYQISTEAVATWWCWSAVVHSGEEQLFVCLLAGLISQTYFCLEL